ncbi:hypothetical protein VNO78_09091 [Psophocarpus tetragonolobus]|uniref:Peptidase metallopeptidase domain-containing protein n=1 Tax=Psophocarpus tetragonolobus TaxID=3891 RepID=A0AAN9SYW2_PSOTE
MIACREGLRIICGQDENTTGPASSICNPLYITGHIFHLDIVKLSEPALSKKCYSHTINMKSSYLVSFLLFLILLSQPSLSNSANLKGLLKKFVSIVYDNRYDLAEWTHDIVERIDSSNAKKKLLSPPPAEERNAQPPVLNLNLNLSMMKDYLSNYGYIQSSGPYNGSLDEETIVGIKTYQKYFNLQVTGKVTRQTLEQMSFLRCGVPDINIDYNLTEDNTTWPKAGKRWFPKGKNITYGFLPESQLPANATKVFRDSFTRWARATGVLNLKEATTYNNADIKIGFYNFTFLEIDKEVYGFSVISLDRNSDKKTGEILLDGSKYWLLPSENYSLLSWEDGILDLESAAMHQIGHLLGLDHSNDTDSVMYPYIFPSHQRKVNLSISDRDNIRDQYAIVNLNVNTAHAASSGLLLFTTFSLGFAYLFLSY